MFDLADLITRAIVLLAAVVVHEWAHAYGAFTQGDTTAYEQGRMTLDPRANVWWPGYIIGVIGGFAILGAAPVNPYRMRNPRTGMLIAVAAGPLSNLVLAALFAVPLRLNILPDFMYQDVAGILPSGAQVLFYMVYLNLVLFLFNLIPLSPLDGWTVLLSLLPARQAVWWERNRQNSMYVLFGLIILGFAEGYMPFLGAINPLNWLVGQPALLLTRILTGG